MSLNNRTSFWNFVGEKTAQSAFGSIDHAIEHTGETISRDPISCVKQINVNNKTYYVKIYHRNGKGLRHYFGRGRIRGEWENLLYFAQMGIPTPRLIAYGQRCRLGQFRLGALITEEVPSHDLATLARENSPLFHDRHWLNPILSQCAYYTKRLHDQGFVHWDLKWRNILISTQEPPQVYFFDCPLGRKRYGWLQQRGIIKDLACLDKVARKTLTRSQRLRFYKLYRCVSRINAKDKKKIAQVIKFFAKERQK
ncbi:MAG: lipopolysaccharide kinase InaA family protein [Thermodesulfobacteriota bacterium]|nr:lipopolysaccharide kinase InaA family protein [Thermodesulfobacteriota bacterium]